MLLRDFVNKKIASADKEASAEGVPLTLNDCKKYKKMRDLKVYGNCFQDGTPTPENPIEVQCVGEKSRNLFDISKSIKDYGGLEATINADGSYNLRGNIAVTFCYFTSYKLETPIQLEVAMKKPHEIVRLSPPKWESGKEYESGQRVSVRLSGDLHIFKAKNAVMGEVSPDRDTEHWEEVPCETYVGFPRDRLYYLYVIAMMDFANQEYDKYANDIAVYNSAFDDFAKWWQRTYGYTHREGYDEYKSQH